MNDSNPRVAIITINWNGFNDTVECVESLLHLSYPNYAIIVVDNGSDNNEADSLQKRFNSQIEIIKSSENLGFSGGNNLALRELSKRRTFDFFLLLNNDTSVTPAFLSELIVIAQRHPKAGIIGSKVLYYNSEKIYCLGGGHLSILTDNYKLIGNKQNSSLSSTAVNARLGYISGCCMLIRQETLDSTGLFDEKYFTYCEETDFCLRAIKNGWALVYAEKSIIYHKVARSSKYLSKKYVYYMLRNRLYFVHKHSSTLFFLFYYCTFFLWKNVLGYIYLSLGFGQLKDNFPFILKAIHDYHAQSFGKLEE